MERYLKNEPKLTSFKKITSELEGQPWAITGQERSGEACSVVSDADTGDTDLDHELEDIPEDEDDCDSGDETETDEKLNNFAQLKLDDTLSLHSFSSSSSAVSWDSNISDPPLSPILNKCHSDPYALKLIAQPGRTETFT
ncbi:hypothetical protein LOTGIDRAFT_166004, partial [Lottia gigantea]